MKHTVILPCLGLLSLASAYAVDTPVAKPGTIAPVTLQATVVTQGAVKSSPVTGGARLTGTTVTSKYANRDILNYMVVAHTAAVAPAPIPNPAIPSTPALLDGTITGWTIVRLANSADVGNLYAVKNGKAAVAVPTFLLTAPTVTGKAVSGTEFAPTAPTGIDTVNFNVKAYGTTTVNNGSGTVSGTQTLKTVFIKINGVSTSVEARTDNFTIIGQIGKFGTQGVASGTVNASYRSPRATPVNLTTTLIPGATAP